MSRKIDPTLGGKTPGLVERATERFEDLMTNEAIHESCESEIEAMLGHVFFACDRLGPGFSPDSFNVDFKVGPNWRLPKERAASVEEVIAYRYYHDPLAVYVWPQVNTFGWTVDFMCYMHDYDWVNDKSQRILLAIECDGHEFHERTKEQARRDRSRDRALLLNNVPTMRFTGSEIWSDPYLCVHQISDFFTRASVNFFRQNSASRKKDQGDEGNGS